MKIRALWRYFIDLNTYNLAFALLLYLLLQLSLVYCLLSLISIGVCIGYLGFQYFKKDEYYFYYNLGFTKKKLLQWVWIMNIIIIGPIILVYYLAKYFLT